MVQQFAFRTQSAAGGQDVLFVLASSVFGYYGKYLSFFRNGLWDAFQPLLTSAFAFGKPDEQLNCA